jgi:hypothetical protein
MHVWTICSTLVPSVLRTHWRSCLPEDPTEDATRNLGWRRIQRRGYTPCTVCLATMLHATVAPALQTDGPNAAGVPELLELRLHLAMVLWHKPLIPDQAWWTRPPECHGRSLQPSHLLCLSGFVSRWFYVCAMRAEGAGQWYAPS